MHHRTRRLSRLLPLTLAAVIGAGVAVGTAAPASAAPTRGAVTVTAPATVADGATFDATVSIAAATDVYAYEATFSFDPAIVSYVAGSATAPAGGFDTVTASGGTVDVIHTRLGSSPALTGTVAFTLKFTAEAPGATAIALSSLRLIDAANVSATTANVAASPSITVTGASSGTPGGNTPTTGTAGDPGSVASSGSGSARGSLASTGQNVDLAPWIGGAVVLVLLGAAAVVLTVVRRRRAGGAR